jgi:DMSO reductase anchor subunit/NAD-dependent dihydropyrimidine dehydrogenase PreA subunit
VDAYEKDAVTGIVHHLDDQCIGCRYCTLMCPYEVPRYHAELGIVRKCDLCADRLADGEPPACAQACPTEAIRVTVVATDDVRREVVHHVGALVPTAPDSGLTVPPTRYRSARGLDAQLRAADDGELVPAHAHPPLVVMLVLTQLAVGVAAAQAALHLLRPDLVDATRTVATATTAGVGLLALAASTLHLGRPRQAWRAVLGLGHSWLSREILAFGSFGGLAGLLAAARFAGVDHGIVGGAGSDVALAVVGLVGVVASALVYAACPKRWWRLRWTLPRFLASAATLAAAASAPMLLVLVGQHQLEASTTVPLVRMLLAIGLAGPPLALLAEWSLVARRGVDDELRRTRALLLGPLREVARGRLGLLAVQTVVGMIALGALGGTPLDIGGASAVGLVFAALVIAGEALHRHLFFVAVSSARMPGAPR